MKTAEKYYMAVVEEQGISEAARKLYITQQSLSEQMQKLEQQYGGKLFLRRPRFRHHGDRGHARGKRHHRLLENTHS